MKRTRHISFFLLLCFVISFIFNSFSYTSNIPKSNFNFNTLNKEFTKKVKEVNTGINLLIEKNESESKSFIYDQNLDISFLFNFSYKEIRILKSVFNNYENKFTLVPIYISFRNLRI